MSTQAQALMTADDSPWIASRRWDLTWLTMSCLLVAVPPLAHTYWKVGATGVDLLVTLLIGGPHMYATFLRTVFEPRFRALHPALAWAPVFVVPVFVVSGAVFAFTALLTFFFTVASLHVCDQAAYIAYLYRERGGKARIWERFLDFAVIAGSLYAVAMYRHVAGTFVIGERTLWFPPVLRHAWFANGFAFCAAALIAAWAVKTWNQWRRGELGGPYLFFMGLTISVAAVITRIGELSVAFQGFNAWHSFQYLGLTFLLLNMARPAGEVTSDFVKKMAEPDGFFRFYGWNILLTTGASLLIGVLVWGLGLPIEQCYYAVVLSFLLTHYCHDAVLFTLGTKPFAA
ncbi:MAG: hypothetical protein ACHQPI_02155 [Thermoanaerobaculia bacterium]